LEERERGIESGGLRVEKGKGQGGYWLKGHLHPFEQNRDTGGGQTTRPVRPAPVIAGALGVGGGRGRGEMERRSRATYSGAHLGRGRLVEVVPRQGTAGGGGWWRRRKWWCWWSKGALLGLEDGVGDGEKTSVLFIGRLRRFKGENISPAVGLAGGGGAWVPAGSPAR
jgi:hypothetical protein